MIVISEGYGDDDDDDGDGDVDSDGDNDCVYDNDYDDGGVIC